MAQKRVRTSSGPMRSFPGEATSATVSRRSSIAFRGIPIRLADEAWRRRVGYAGHLGGLYDNLTLAENLDLCARLYDLDRAEVHTALARLGLRELARRPAGSLSVGLRRRAAVARALVHDPEVLLLDEPYANLDENSVTLVSDALRAWRRPGRVALIATHGAKELKRWADAGVVLKSGRIAVAGRYDRSPRPRRARA